MARLLPIVFACLPAAACRAAQATEDVGAAPEVCEVDAVLEMKDSCQRCEAHLGADGAAYICSYECTFCAGCTSELSSVCPNCGGELAARPRRRPESPANSGGPGRSGSTVNE